MFSSLRINKLLLRVDGTGHGLVGGVVVAARKCRRLHWWSIAGRGATGEDGGGRLRVNVLVAGGSVVAAGAPAI